MSDFNWAKDASRQRMQRQGVENRAATSKDALRREADRLLAGYTGPVTKVPTGTHLIGSYVSGARKSRSSPATISKSKPRTSMFDRDIPAGIVIYCDGACEPNPGQGGWGFVVYNDCEEVFHASGGDLSATNQTMELTAAIGAMEWIVDHEFKPPIQIFSDSQYVVNGCNEWRHAWKRKGWRRGGPNAAEKNSAIANLDLWQELDRLLTIVPITLEWCKGHVGIVGNERADELSLMGREQVLDAAREVDPIYQQLRSRG